MEEDPIVDSPAKRRRTEGYNSEDDSGDELFRDYDETVATLPLTEPYNPAAQTQASRYFEPTQANTVTQPTQILDTPIARRTDPNSIVQVAASSPLTQPPPPSSPPSQRRKPMPSIAPPGTNFRPPPRLQTNNSASFDDDPPVVESSEDELAAPSRSDIRPTDWRKPANKSTTAAVGNQSAFQQIMARYEYPGTSNQPQKRSANDMANGYSASSKRPRIQPRQTGPSRAQPVSDMTLEDISDFLMQRKVQRMTKVYPSRPISVLYEALNKKRGNFDDALAYICELDEQEQAQDNTIDLTLEDDSSPIKPAKPSAKREVKPTKSINDKWSSTQAPAVKRDVGPSKSIQEKWSAKPIEIVDEPTSPVKPPRRRLVQGRRNAVPSASPEPATPEKPVPVRQKKVITIDSDEESEAGASTDEEEEEEANVEIEQGLLDYINACSAQDLADLSNQSVKIAEGVLAKRPFKSLDQIRRIDIDPPVSAKSGKRRANRKTTGEKVMDTAEETWAGYESVDTLVQKCKNLGKPLTAAMKQLGVNIHGQNGELNLTNLEDARQDSGIGTPSSSAQAEDEDGDEVVSTTKSKLLQKPSIMADDLVLKDYQIVGLNWMSILWRNNVSGILADDMGLGKTCQVIALLSHLFEIGETGPHLVIVPGSTLENWLREFKNFSPNLHVRPYYGSILERPMIRAQIEDDIDNINVIVTTYETAYNNKDDNKFLRRLGPKVCVYDEAHMLRNSQSKRYKELMRIPAEFRLLLTGTPLQNNLQELVSILAFLMPGLFQEQQENLQYIFKNKAKTTDESHAGLLSAQRIARARSMMTPFILRRKKHQVLKHMVKKTCRVEYCELLPKQSKIYNTFLDQQKRVLEDRAAGRPNPDHANVMSKLRLAAVHPLLSRNFYDDDKLKRMARDYIKRFPDREEERVLEELIWENDMKISKLIDDVPDVLGKYQLPEDAWTESGKILKMMDLVQQWAKNGDRILIFSQFTMGMDIMERVLERINIPFFRLDGDTPISARQDMLDEFYRDESIPVFMLSTKSGGAGINLACANKVLIFDCSFNPQDDIQAENRAHRVGQTRDVEVVRLVTKGTIEEQIYALGESKLALDERVAGADAEASASGATVTAKSKASAKGKDGAQSLTGAEEAGLDLVERMMLEQMHKSSQGGAGAEHKDEANGDIKEEFIDGMKKAGVQIAA